MRRRSSLLGPTGKGGDRAELAGGKRSIHGTAVRGESKRTTGGSPPFGAASSGDNADKSTGKKMNLGDNTTIGGRTREGRRASQQTKQKSRSKHKHAGQRATLHRKKEGYDNKEKHLQGRWQQQHGNKGSVNLTTLRRQDGERRQKRHGASLTEYILSY